MDFLVVAPVGELIKLTDVFFEDARCITKLIRGNDNRHAPDDFMAHPCVSASLALPAINTHANFASGFRLHGALSLDGGGDDVLRHHRHADGGGLSGRDPAGGR